LTELPLTCQLDHREKAWLVPYREYRRTSGLRIPKVSVVMAVYNGARYVSQAIDSILSQTLEDFEFIIVDDGSTDGTSSILRSCGDRRIFILENENNVGLAESLNRGIAGARGQYVARQDADDISGPERLLRQAGYLDLHPTIGVVATATRWIDSEGNLLQIWPSGMDNGELQQRLLETCYLIHGSTMFRRRCFQEAGGYDASMRSGQDYDFWLRVSEVWDLVCLPDVLYTYRYHQDMASVRHRGEQMCYAEIGRARAIRRRTSYAQLALGPARGGLPSRLRAMSRRQLAQRYTWWSAAARRVGRSVALRFLLIALFIDPTAPEIWSYIRGILARKIVRITAS
jgi:glycosyltransferase involved in cell wall biosynthesis